jgi:large subunit ribosomal protein L22
MAKHKYAAKFSKENTAMVVGRTLPISTKQSIEICNFIRNKNVQKAKALLNDVLIKKIAVPFKRFTAVGHKRGKMAAGRYPQKSTKEILRLLESAEANAQFKGLGTADLMIIHICAHKASSPWHYGRQRRRKMKRTTIEVVVKEKVETKKEEKPKVEEKKPGTQTKSEPKKKEAPKKEVKEENKK